MLKTLRVTSLVMVLLAAVGVVAIAVFGLKGDPDIVDFLAKAGIVDKLRGEIGSDAPEEKSSPLVALAQAFALRIDPPPPPPPPKPDKPVAPPKELARNKVNPPIPTPKVQTQMKSDLLATVVYESFPTRSLALLKTTGNKQEWFRQGEKVGHLEIQEIRDGSVVFTQGGRNPQEKFVPAKPPVKSLLKSEQTTSAVPRPGSGSIVSPSPVPSVGAAVPGADAASTTRSARTTRPTNQTPRTQTNTSGRIQRVRSAPKPPSPQEQKRSLEQTMSGIEAIMNRQDESLSEEDRKKEDEMWKKLAEMLGSEKQQLEKTIESQDNSGKDDAEKTPSKNAAEKPEKKPQNTKKPAVADPNKP